MTYRYLQALILIALFASSVGAAGAAEPFPGTAPDRRLMKAQEKSDELFEQGQYQRAMMIYRKELAPVGDKYAQYMVGYMYLAAKGVDEDIVAASAWYQLAAERGHESFTRARDVLLQALNDEQRARSNKLYADLSAELGDVAIISGLISDDLAQLRRRSSPDARLNLNSARGETVIRGDDYYRKLSKQIDARMRYLLALAESNNSISPESLNEIYRLQGEVHRALDTIK